MIILLILLLIMLWPQRVVLHLDDGQLLARWLPLPRLACGVRLFCCRLALADVLAHKPAQTSRLKQKLALAAASAVAVQGLRVQVTLGGGPFAAAMLGGALFAALHTALARASCAVAAFAPTPADCVAVGLLPAGASLSQSSITARAELRFCLGRVCLAVLLFAFGIKSGGKSGK